MGQVELEDCQNWANFLRLCLNQTKPQIKVTLGVANSVVCTCPQHWWWSCIEFLVTWFARALVCIESCDQGVVTLTLILNDVLLANRKFVWPIHPIGWSLLDLWLQNFFMQIIAPRQFIIIVISVVGRSWKVLFSIVTLHNCHSTLSVMFVFYSVIVWYF